ncbi:MAG TPA: VOC family protein [Acidimicrobiales bacterium]|nr:VOC family protein [Acidimicrobiales bacterium]
MAAIAARPLTATSSRWVAVSGDVMPQTRRHPSAPRGRASVRRSRALCDGVSFVGARREPSLWWREDLWSCSRPARAESDECRRAAHHEGAPPAMKVIRIVPNLSSEAFVASRAFYTAMFDLVVSVELDDWYLQLMPESDTRLNIGFVKPDHELFADRTAPSGTYGVVLTIQVDDVDEAYKRAKRLGAEIAADIRNEDYGQRHFLLVDPNGLVLNVMSIL